MIACDNKLADSKKLAGWQADYLHARASEMDSDPFISEVKDGLLYGIQWTYQSEQKTQTKCFAQATACAQNKPLI